MNYLIIILLSLTLLADSNISDDSYYKYEQYRHNITDCLHKYSENIDQFLSDSNVTYDYTDSTKKTSTSLV